MKTTASTLFLAALLLAFMPGALAESNDLFIERDTARSPAEVVSSIRDFVENDDDWIYLADFPLKGGELTAVKICFLPIGADIFAAGLHVGAMMPCGHIAVYENDGRTHLSLLHPRFMTELYPDPNLERAVAKAVPAFEAMLEAVWD